MKRGKVKVSVNSPLSDEENEDLAREAEDAINADDADDTESDAEPKAVKVRQLGDPIVIDTCLQLHLVAAKRKRDQLPQAEHGISFRRVGRDAHVYATDSKSAVRLVLAGMGPLVPEKGCVLPAKASKLISASDDEQALIWFTAGRGIVQVDGDVHEFRLIDVLPFPGDDSATFADAEKAPRRVSCCAINAAQLARLQKAMAVEWMEIVQPTKGLLLALPEGRRDSDRLGALALYSSVEEAE